MIEIAVEMDDDADGSYLMDGAEPDVETLRRLIRKGTIAIKFIPSCVGLRFKNKGVQPLLNAVIDYLPSRWTLSITWALSQATKQKHVTSRVVRMMTCRSLRLRSRSGMTPSLAP